jgi:hypothetical protein
MDDIELKSIWQSYDAKLEKSLKVNLQLFETMQGQKVTSSFNAVVRLKIFLIFLGALWIGFIGFLLFHYHTEPFFVGSAILIIGFTAASMVGYVQQISMIKTINYRESVTETQQKLALLQASFLRYLRIAILQMPVYTVFYIRMDMFGGPNPVYWIIQVAITGFFLVWAIWFYRNISYRNIKRPWLSGMLQPEGQRSIEKMQKFMEEIEEFRNELK